jgi:hypothetical protein
MSGLFNQASLVLVPSGYKSGKVYSEVPTDGDGDLTFTRASSATRVNSDGEIEVVGSGIPRLDYSQGSCPALLLEPQRTNLQVYSNSFISNWNLNDVTTSVGESTLIDGQSTILMTENTANAVHRVVSTIVTTLTIGQTYTMSFYVKSNGSRNIGLRTGITGTSANIIFNPNTQAVVSLPSGFTANITSANDGYYRYSITATASVSSDLLSIVMFSGTSLVYTGSEESIYISACQTEAGSYATSYIPTTSATVTRLADACSKTGISSLIGQTEGTVFFDANFDDSDTVNFSISDGTSSNYVLIDTTSARSVFARVQQGGVTQAQISTTSSFYSVGERLKCAIAYKSNDFAFYINGTSIGTDNSGSVPALDQLRFSRWNGALAATQRINQTMLFPTRLTNAELAELTTL